MPVVCQQSAAHGNQPVHVVGGWGVGSMLRHAMPCYAYGVVEVMEPRESQCVSHSCARGRLVVAAQGMKWLGSATHARTLRIQAASGSHTRNKDADKTLGSQ